MKNKLKTLLANQEKEDEKYYTEEENCKDYCCTCGDDEELIRKYVVNIKPFREDKTK